ncbi:MAG: SDR family oxidoreductase [Syntrophobacter sp.]
MRSEPVLVLGATGYVGGRLVPRLLEAGYRVRVMGRSEAKLESRPWASHPLMETVQGDVLHPASLEKAARGCWAAFFLVQSVGGRGNGSRDAQRRAAWNMVAASLHSSLERIIYLGPLGGDCNTPAGRDGRSRCEVAATLQSGRVPVTVFLAPTILGSGSASFEVMRYLADRQPVVLAPLWMQAPIQPISIRNVLFYLMKCLEQERTIGETFEIGGPDILSFQDLIQIYAELAGLRKRIILQAPFVTPRLGALWIHLITPVPAAIVEPLSEGLVRGGVCHDTRIHSILPQDLLGVRETIRRALEHVEKQTVEACWTDAGALRPPEWTWYGDEQFAGGAIMRCGYSIRLRASPEEVWEHIVRIGGQTGWYYGGSLWRMRGWLDKVFGGTSLSRGRRHPSILYVGDALDFWRVLEVAAPQRLLLLSEMKMPGEAILEFEITDLGNGQTDLKQLSRFRPRGIAGLLYWYSLYPPHQWLFRGMLKTIADAVGKPVLGGPARFTPKLENRCAATDTAKLRDEHFHLS